MNRLLLSKASQKFIKKIKDKNLKDKIKSRLESIKADYTIGNKRQGI